MHKPVRHESARWKDEGRPVESARRCIQPTRDLARARPKCACRRCEAGRRKRSGQLQCALSTNVTSVPNSGSSYIRGRVALRLVHPTTDRWDQSHSHGYKILSVPYHGSIYKRMGFALPSLVHPYHTAKVVDKRAGTWYDGYHHGMVTKYGFQMASPPRPKMIQGE